MRHLSAIRSALAAALLIAAGPAAAHPHVWVTMTSEIVFARDGSVTGVRHAWSFDDMFSAFATMGIKAKKKGEFTREELRPLAQTNVESLKEYEYFTNAKINGAKTSAAFSDPVDYWLDYEPKAGVLTLHFTLPLKTPVQVKTLDLEVYDPDFFIFFAFAETNPVRLAGASPQCKAGVARAQGGDFPLSLRGMFSSSEANAGLGAQYAHKVVVKCP